MCWRYAFPLLLSLLPLAISDIAKIRYKFEKSFNDSCLKYPFVHNYWQTLEDPTVDKFVVFVFHEPGLKNGGFGDRLGGLVTAAMFAFRMNRVLLIQSSNGFDHLFRPYRRPDLTELHKNDHNPYERYTYSNWTSWTGYDPSKSNNDASELDLWNCINMNNQALCGLEYVYQPTQAIIKYRGNRAYLCRWLNQVGAPVWDQMRDMKLNKEMDLFEVAGCALRLVMWPTDKLWLAIEKILEAELGFFKEDIEPYLVGQHFRCGDGSYTRGPSYARSCEHATDPSDAHPESDYMVYGTPVDVGSCTREVIDNYTRSHFQVSGTRRRLRVGERVEGIHDRRYDRTSGSGIEEEVSVVVRELRELRELNEKLHDERTAEGPNDDTDADHIIAKIENYESLIKELKLKLASLMANTTVIRVDEMRRRVVVYIASDSIGSALQMNRTTAWPNTFISPQGCHVQLDPSEGCTTLTLSYWLVLALSDVLITQTQNRMPCSAFSRFAAIYGLKKNVLVDAKDCGRPFPTFNTSHLWNGNWFC